MGAANMQVKTDAADSVSEVIPTVVIFFPQLVYHLII
jgi:hypothetical protein